MKKIMCAVALLLCFTAAPAVADESTDALLETITRLQDKVALRQGPPRLRPQR